MKMLLCKYLPYCMYIAFKFPCKDLHRNDVNELLCIPNTSFVFDSISLTFYLYKRMYKLYANNDSLYIF